MHFKWTAAFLLVVSSVGGPPAAQPMDPAFDFSLPIEVPATPCLRGDCLEVDVDGDGDRDRITDYDIQSGQSVRNGVQVERRLEDGSFAAPERYEISFAPIENVDRRRVTEIHTAEITGDARPDLAIFVWPPRQFGVMRNAGDGTYESPRYFADRNTEVRRFAFGDLDADLDADCVLAFDAELAIHRNRGDGTFDSMTSIPISEAGRIEIAEMNSDGRPDIVCPWFGGYVPNLGNAVFGVPTRFGAGAYGEQMMLFDFEGDGRMDVVLISPFVYIVQSLGSGFAVTQDAINVRHGAVQGEFNGDEAPPDFAVRESSGGVRVYLNTQGSFSVTTYAVDASDDLVMADFNQDGIDDLIADGPLGFVPLVSGAPLLRAGRLYAQSGDAVAGDHDRDGHLDLEFQIQGKNLLVRGNGDGTFAAPWAIESTGIGLAGADLNSDGRTDLVGMEVTGPIVALSTGSGTFSTQAQTIPGFSEEGGEEGFGKLLAIDLSRDGRPDIAVSRGGSFSVCLNTGTTPIFTEVSHYASGTHTRALASADLDGDGAMDLIDGGWANFLLVHRNTGDGHFEGPRYVDAGGDVRHVAAGDFTSDGRPDLVAAVATRGLLLFVNADSLDFLPPTTLSGADDRTAVLTADLDDDGDQDILFAADPMLIFLSRGDGTFEMSSLDFCCTNPHIEHLNADRLPDLFGGPPFQAALNRGGGAFEIIPVPGYTPSGSSYAQVLDDFDDDGRPDLVLPGMLCLNRTGGPTPVVISDCEAAWTSSGVQLRWSLAPSVVASVSRVHVHRALGGEAEVALAALLPERSMEFLDASVEALGAREYRLAIEWHDGRIETGARMQVPASWNHDALVLDVRIPALGEPVRIRYELGRAATVDLSVYDVRGRVVRHLIQEPRNAATHLHNWDRRDGLGASVARGIYLVRLEANGRTRSRKLLLHD